MSESGPTTIKKHAQGLWANKRVRLGVLIGGGALALVALLGTFKPDDKTPYRTEAVRRTDVTRSVSASGSLDAVDSVTVGSQLSGQVLQVLVDFNATVKKGQLLAVIDPTQYEARILQAQASVDQADADLRVGQADYDRQQRLAAADLVATKTAQDAAATRDKARAEMKTAKAGLSSAQADLAKAKITSPIDGVVVNRTIDPGQTVAASLNAPELFVIAKDLAKMQINVSVDEADIGQVHEGQKVKFTVDAFPDDTFQAVVSQVRKQPIKAANVVTYTVIALADNPDRKLLPGMTANADIVIEEHPNVLAAPASALRWKPVGVSAPTQSARGDVVASAGGGGNGGGGGGAGGGGRGFGGGGRQYDPDQSPLLKDLALDDKQKASIKSIGDGARLKMQAVFQSANGDRDAMRAQMTKMRKDTNDQIAVLLRPDQKVKFEAKLAEQQGQRAASGGGEKLTRRTIYLLVDNKPKAANVMVGANDGTLMEVRSGVNEGDLVITGGGPPDKKVAATTTPFGAGAGGGRRGGAGGFGGGFGAP